MKRTLLLSLILYLVPMVVLAQSVKVTGKVTDAKDGTPMPGITVQTQDKSAGAVTLADGIYTIDVKKGDLLTFSSLGMKAQTVKVENQTVINIAMEESSFEIDELVVIAYGKVRKRDLTGSVGQIKGDDLMKGNPALSINSALQGKMAGVQVQQTDGAPGGGINLTIRGANSFTTNTQPIFIVDGLPYGGGGDVSSGLMSRTGSGVNPLANINPNDIESIEILKDASATALYGSRGANGVVLITTKRGKEGKDKISFSSNFGFSKVGKRVEVLDPVTYARYINEQRMRSNPDGELPYRGEWYYKHDMDDNIITDSGKYSPSPEDFLNPGERVDQYGNKSIVGSTDWQDAIFRTGYTKEYNISISGATDKGGYAISGNYLKQNGIIENSDYKRYSLRSNVYRKLYSWLEVGMNLSYTNSITNFVNSSSSSSAVIYSALVFPPVYGSEINSREENELNWLSANPYVYVREAFDQQRANNFSSSAYMEVKLLPGLKFRQNIGFGSNTAARYQYYNRLTQQGSYPNNGVAGQGDSWSQGTTSESLLSYDKAFNEDHTFGVLVGSTFEDSNWAYKNMTAKNFPSDLTMMWNMGAGLEPQQLVSGRSRTQMQSTLARVNYAYKGKYLATASFRRDGASVFNEDKKYANFFSGALAWRISEENLIKNIHFLDDAKLRMSYGETGNSGIGTYATQSVLEPANYVVDGVVYPGYAEPSWRGARNPNLKWETTAQIDAGLDASFLKGRISLTVDAYHKKTKELLQRAKIESSSGFDQTPTNSGWVKNKGLEFAGKFNPIRTEDFNWVIDANISFNKNEIGGLDSDQYAAGLWSGMDDLFVQRNGLPIGAIIGFVEDGFYDNLAEVRADPRYSDESKISDAIAKSMIGEIKYRDVNGDGLITNADKVIIGDTNPKFIYGITNTLTWRNFTMGFFFQGSYGNDILNANLLNGNARMAGIGNITRDQYDSRWTEDNTAGAKWPKAVEGGYTREFQFSNRYVEKGSYVRLKNLNLGYSFDPKIQGVGRVNVSVSATNLFTITNYSWYDPDVSAFGGDVSRRGVDLYSYPSSRTYTLGINIEF